MQSNKVAEALKIQMIPTLKSEISNFRVDTARSI